MPTLVLLLHATGPVQGQGMMRSLVHRVLLLHDHFRSQVYTVGAARVGGAYADPFRRVRRIGHRYSLFSGLMKRECCPTKDVAVSPWRLASRECRYHHARSILALP